VSPKPSVCFFNTSPAMPHMLLGEGPDQAGGAEARASILARVLTERGWPVSFAVYDYGQPDEVVTPEGIRLFRASGRKTGPPLLRVITHTVPADMRAFRAADANTYVEFGVSWRTGLLVREAHKHRRKFIVWLASINHPYAAVKGRSWIPREWRWSAHRGLIEADIVIAQTVEQKQAMWELYRRDCPVIPNIWPVTPHVRQKSVPAEVLWAARYLPLKRPEWVLEAATHLPETRFVMAGGPGEGHEALFRQIQDAARGIPNVEILGFVPFKDIGQHYARASALLCTSTIEGFPNTFLQAWNHGTPVVSTLDPDGVLEREGVGIACQWIDEITMAIQRICGPDGAEMGARCRAYVERVHSVSAVMDALEPLLGL
jgi:glycosyltransferase involved in cell wall biosynthesis